MSQTEEASERRYRAGTYEFDIKGHLPDTWEDWFEGLAVHRKTGGATVLRGEIEDQTHLHGILLKIRNLNLELISVNRVDDESEGDVK